MKRMKQFSILVFAATLLLAFWGNFGVASDKPKRGGTLIMAITRDIRNMNPLVQTGRVRTRRALMFEPLVTLDLEGNIRPNLAESWDISKDGKVYTFHLRKGVKFHDGQEMTAEDAKYAIDYTMNPANGAYGLSLLKGVEGVAASDKHTLRIGLRNANPAFLYTVADIRAFSVVPKGSLEEGISNPARYPPGTGPFKFLEWKPRQRIVFDRFNEYWGHKAFVDRLVMKPIRDAIVRFTALRAGDVDIAERTPYEWVKRVLEGKVKGIGFARARYGAYRGIEVNVADPPFNNKKLRLAMAHAIDRNEILQAAFFGFGEVSDQKYPKGHVWYVEGVRSPEYNLGKAKKLLKEAGYQGETIPLLARHGEAQEVESVTIQAQLKKIGMNVKLVVLDTGAHSDLQRKGKYAFGPTGGRFGADFWSTYSIFMCEAYPRRRARNITGYCDKDLDALFRGAQIEMNPKNRRELLRQIVTKLAEDTPVIHVGFVPRFYTFRDYVKDFTTDIMGNYRWLRGGLNYTWLDK